jgi:hypothetical protein
MLEFTGPDRPHFRGNDQQILERSRVRDPTIIEEHNSIYTFECGTTMRDDQTGGSYRLSYLQPLRR